MHKNPRAHGRATVLTSPAWKSLWEHHSHRGVCCNLLAGGCERIKSWSHKCMNNQHCCLIKVTKSWCGKIFRHFYYYLFITSLLFVFSMTEPANVQFFQFWVKKFWKLEIVKLYAALAFNSSVSRCRWMCHSLTTKHKEKKVWISDVYCL